MARMWDSRYRTEQLYMLTYEQAANKTLFFITYSPSLSLSLLSYSTIFYILTLHDSSYSSSSSKHKNVMSAHIKHHVCPHINEKIHLVLVK